MGFLLRLAGLSRRAMPRLAVIGEPPSAYNARQCRAAGGKVKKRIATRSGLRRFTPNAPIGDEGEIRGIIRPGFLLGAFGLAPDPGIDRRKPNVSFRACFDQRQVETDRKSTRLNSSHVSES